MATDDVRMARNIELAVRIGALFLVIYLVTQIVAPFIPVIAWAVIIAVAIYPSYRWLLARLQGRSKLAATIVTIFALLLLAVPIAWLGRSIAEWGTVIAQQINAGTLRIPPPPEKVASWPLIGREVHDYWALATTNLSDAVKSADVEIRAIGKWLLRTAAGMGLGVLQFTLSTVIAGAILIHAEGGATYARKLFKRLVPEAGTDFVTLSEKTIRSVAIGVIGVALIQAALIGAALVIIGVPGAPILIVVTALLGILQLPASLVTIPALIWVWGSQETLAAALFTAWIIPAGLADNVLKPILLGRGVAAPMVVIFIGAIGGFLLAGIIGLFVGAVALVLTYELFQAWLNEGSTIEPPVPDSNVIEERTQ